MTASSAFPWLFSHIARLVEPESNNLWKQRLGGWLSSPQTMPVMNSRQTDGIATQLNAHQDHIGLSQMLR